MNGNGGADHLRGEGGPDILVGGDGNDQLDGGDGSDNLSGGVGNDLLVGGDGQDYLNGGADDDIVIAGVGEDTVLGDTGNDYLDGGDGNDLLMGGAGNDTVLGADGNDYVNGGAGDDLVFGGNGADVLIGDDGNDYLNGEVGDDIVFAGSGNDTVLGADGNDYLAGGEGNDNLTGGLGDDTLFAGAGSDYLKGDAGDDFFIFEANFGTSLIIDFETGTPAHHDFILFKGGVFVDSADVLAHAVQQATNVVITASTGDSLTLANVQLARILSRTISGSREHERLCCRGNHAGLGAARRGSPQPPESRECLQEPIRRGLDPAAEEADAGQDEEGAHRLLDRGEARAHALQEREKGVHGKRREEEGDAEAGRVDGKQRRAAPDAGLGAGDGEDRGEDRADAGRPAEGEGEPHHIGAPDVDGFRRAEPRLAIEEADPEQAHEVQAHDDDRDAGKRREQADMLAHDVAERRGGRAEEHEHAREAGDEQERGQDRPAAHGPVVARLHLVEGHPGEIGKVGRHERQHARAQETDEPAEQRRREGNLEHAGVLEQYLTRLNRRRGGIPLPLVGRGQGWGA